MKKLIILFAWLPFAATAQQADSTLYLTARSSMQKGDFQQALLYLERARQEGQASYPALRDEVYIHFLQRNFARAIDLGKQLLQHPAADIQAYQLVGSCYKGIAEYRDAEKLYKSALQKFPDNAVLLAEYGDLMAQRKKEGEAIELWEKGIQSDPNYSANYYHATRYYAGREQWLKAAILGEIFMNIESFTPRTAEIRQLVSDSYRNLFSQAGKQPGGGFYGSVGAFLLQAGKGFTLSPESLTFLRGKLVNEWYKQNHHQYPFRLFEHHKQLMGEGIFEAYNQWLFDDGKSYSQWSQRNARAAQDLTAFQRGRLYKTPKGQWYR